MAGSICNNSAQFGALRRIAALSWNQSVTIRGGRGSGIRRSGIGSGIGSGQIASVVVGSIVGQLVVGLGALVVGLVV